MAEQGHGGKRIATAADNVAVRAGAIAAVAREQRQATGQILGSLERMQDLPRENMKRMEGMAAAIATLAEQAALLRRELVNVTVARGVEKTGTGPG
jgi:methyl-accepting chemotaxis protein